MEKKVIFCCEDSLDGIFTAIYDGFAYKKAYSKEYKNEYKDNISISIKEADSMELFAEYILVETNLEKAAKTMDYINRKLGYHIFELVYQALCHFDAQRGSIVFGFLVRAFTVGITITERLADYYVNETMRLARKVGNECQRLYGFLRFRDMNHFLYAQLEPKCNVLPIILNHFEDRYPNENYIIYDKNREIAIIHRAYNPSILAQSSEFQLDLSEHTDAYEILWKQYFETMEIKERHNETCQRNMMPKWYRKNMFEQQK